VTTFQIARKVDTGGILMQKRVEVAPLDNAGTLGQKLADVGADLVMQTLQGLAAGTLIPKPQDDALATRAPKLTADDRPIRWHEPAQVSHNRVRALAPAPGATVRRNDKMLKVLETEYRNTPTHQEPGTMLNLPDATGLAVATGQGILILRRLQPEGKAVMSAEAHLRGNPVVSDERLE
jgi:methionyl-tRNA formyltransferase